MFAMKSYSVPNRGVASVLGGSADYLSVGMRDDWNAGSTIGARIPSVSRMKYLRTQASVGLREKVTNR